MKDKAKHNNESVSSRLTGPLAALLLVNFTGSMGFSIVMPFLVFLVRLSWVSSA
jgi:hypothetical protein